MRVRVRVRVRTPEHHKRFADLKNIAGANDHRLAASARITARIAAQCMRVRYWLYSVWWNLLAIDKRSVLRANVSEQRNTRCVEFEFAVELGDRF
jgi:hypothetical protein